MALGEVEARSVACIYAARGGGVDASYLFHAAPQRILFIILQIGTN